VAADDSFLKRNRARARNRFVLMAVLLAFALGSVAWKAVGLVRRMSRPDVEEVRVFAYEDLTASWDGRGYGKDEIDRLLADVAARHPGAYVLVCAPSVRNPTGAMLTLRTLQHGLKGGLVRDGDARCRP
jgi:hypothetical protein